MWLREESKKRVKDNSFMSREERVVERDFESKGLSVLFIWNKCKKCKNYFINMRF